VVEAIDDDRTVIRRLLQLYHYDFSEFDGSDVNLHGEYLPQAPFSGFHRVMSAPTGVRARHGASGMPAPARGAGTSLSASALTAAEPQTAPRQTRARRMAGQARGCAARVIPLLRPEFHHMGLILDR